VNDLFHQGEFENKSTLHQTDGPIYQRTPRGPQRKVGTKEAAISQGLVEKLNRGVPRNRRVGQDQLKEKHKGSP